MNFLKKFFRSQEDGFTFPAFSHIHFILVLVMFALALAIFFLRNKIKEKKTLKNLSSNLIIALLVLQQVIFIFFSIAMRDDSMEQIMPLYTCRLVIYTSFFALVSGSSRLKGLSIYLGIFGSLIPMIYPDLMAYSWPHIMYVNYFMTHYLILVTSLYFIFIEDYRFNNHDLKFSLITTNIYLLIACIVNHILKSNYAYMNFSPVFKDRFTKLPLPIYHILVIMIYNLLIILVHKSLVFVQNKFAKDKHF